MVEGAARIALLGRVEQSHLQCGPAGDAGRARDEASVGQREVEYARRRASVVRCAGCARALTVTARWINLWIRVSDERSALLTLAAQGIGAAPGEPFMVRNDRPHIRVTVGLVDDWDHHVAWRLAEAAAMHPSRAGHR